MRVINVLLLAATAAAQPADPLLPGLQAFQRADYVAAERQFTASSDPRAKTFLALTQSATSRCPIAEPELARSFEASKGDVGKLAGLALAQCQIATGKFDQAAPVLAKLRGAYPSDADVLYLSARLQMRQWNDTMYQLYRRAPASFRVNQISGEVLETQGRFAEAAGEYRKAIAKSPNTVGLHYRLARSLLLTSHEPDVLRAALQEFQAELKLNPHDAAAHFQAGEILLAQGDEVHAAENWQRAIASDPNFPEPLVALGKLRLRQKNAEAIPLLRRAVELAPNNEAAHYNLMMAYRDAGRLDDAKHEKAELDRLQKSPEGEFTEFLKKLGEAAPKQ